MPLNVPASLESEVDEILTHYPQKRSASLMVLHAAQDHFGWISRGAIEWIARKLELQPINIYELVTFYPMFRQEPAGRNQIKVCRTLSCALGGSYRLHRSEEHTSELQSQFHLVCRLPLEKKKPAFHSLIAAIAEKPIPTK